MNTEELVKEYIKHCTDEELDELTSGSAQGIISLDYKCDHAFAEQEGILWDVMNDEVDAEDVRRYIAERYIEAIKQSDAMGLQSDEMRQLFDHCWTRLFSTLESQGYRPTPHGLTHESEL